MNTPEIKILLEKYYDGETSLDEERILKKYFCSDQVDEQLQEHIPAFSFLKNEKTITSSQHLEDQILEKLNAQSTTHFYKTRTFWTYFSGIAATLLFLFTFIFESQYNTKTDQSYSNSSFSDQETQLAYDQTKIALAYVSGKYARGTEPLEEVAKFNKSTIAMTQLAKMGAELDKVKNNVGKMDNGVNNLKQLSKFSIIIKP